MPPFKKYKLGELAERITSGGTPSTSVKEYYGGNIPWLKTQEVNFNRIYKTETFITDEGLKNSSAKLIKENSVIIAMYGNTAAKVAINKIPLTTNQACCNITLDRAKADYRYIYYFFVKEYENLKNLSNGGAQQNLNAGIIKEYEVDLPDLPTQTRIASILSSLDDKIELNRRTNHTLEQIAQTLFKKYFVDDIDPENLPYGWRWGTLSEIIEFSNGYAFSSKELLDENKPNCYHVFKMGHIKRGGGLNSEGTKSFIEKSKTEGLEKYILRKGDLLMCMTDMKDSMALLGHTALMNENDKYIVNQRVGLIRARNELNIGHAFLYLLTNSVDFIEDLRSRANSGVQVNLSTNEIKQSRIVIPSKAINIEFQKNVDPIYEKIFQLAKENEKLVETRDSLLPKLMSGEIEVNAIEKELLDK